MKSIQNSAIVNAEFAQNVWQLVKNKGGELISITIDNPDGGSGLLGKYGVIKEMYFEFPSENSVLGLTIRFNPDYSDFNLATDITFRDLQYNFERSIRIDGNDIRPIGGYINDIVKEWRSKGFGKDEKVNVDTDF